MSNACGGGNSTNQARFRVHWVEDGGAGPITFEMPEYQKEAAFFIALMGWKLRSDDGKQAVLDIGDWGIWPSSGTRPSNEVP